MKKIIILILTLSICLSLCACGTRNTAATVEGLISAIGEVSLDSEAAVEAAEEAYNALSEAQKAKVENYAELSAARELLNKCIMDSIFLGEWVDLRYGVLTFNEDGTYTYFQFRDGYGGLFEYEENAVHLGPSPDRVSFELAGKRYFISAEHYIEGSFEPQEINGIEYLVSPELKMAFVRREYAGSADHEINIDNWQEYFTLEMQMLECENASGEVYTEYEHCLVLKDEYADRLVPEFYSEYGINVELSYNSAVYTTDKSGEGFVVTGTLTTSNDIMTKTDYFDQAEIGMYCGVLNNFPAGNSLEGIEGIGPTVIRASSHYDYGRDSWVIHSVENLEISSIQGSLRFFDLPLHNEITREITGLAG